MSDLSKLTAAQEQTLRKNRRRKRYLKAYLHRRKPLKAARAKGHFELTILPLTEEALRARMDEIMFGPKPDAEVKRQSE